MTKCPVVVGITGASGALYAVRVLEILTERGTPVELIVTDWGRRVLLEETGRRPEDLAGDGVTLLPNDDLGAGPASGSHDASGMIVVPCSSGTLGRIAAGTSSNLLLRAADVMLKERRPLVLAPRETPVSLIQIRNMAVVTEAGGIIMPASPAFYGRPEKIEDLVDFIARRAIALLDRGR